MLGIAAVAVLALAAPAPTDVERPITVKLKRDDDKATVKTEDGRTVIDIACPTGIGDATIERTADAWPDGVTVRLRVRGLEFFQAAGGKVTIRASVKSYADDNPVRQSVDGPKETPLAADSPYRMDVRIIGDDGKPSTAISQKGGYVELRVPKSYFEGNPKTVTFSWIDFYRR